MLGLLIHQSVDEVPLNEPILGHLPEIEAAGYTSLYVVDHRLHVMGGGYIHPLLLLAHAAARTTKLELGQAILLGSFYHPLLLAELAASLDQLSKGRLVLGLGSGWNQDEFRAYGLDFETRHRRFKESLAIVRQYWTNEVLDFDGEFFQLDNVRRGVAAYGERKIPMYQAATTDATLKRLRAAGDGWIPSQWTPRAKIAASMELLRDTDGPEVPLVVNRVCSIRRNSQDAEALASQALQKFTTRDGAQDHPFIGKRRDVLLDRDVDQEGGTLICGSPAQVLEQIQSYVDLGARRVNLRLAVDGMTAADVAESLDLVTTEVLPHIAGVAQASAR